MSSRNVNLLAVFVATLAYYALGAAWYSALSAQWVVGIGKTMEQLQAGGGGPAPYLISFGSDFLATLVLAWIIASTGGRGAVRGAALGAVLGVGFLATSNAQQDAFEQRGLGIFFINTGYSVLGMMIAGAIVGAWPQKEKAAAPSAAP